MVNLFVYNIATIPKILTRKNYDLFNFDLTYNNFVNAFMPVYIKDFIICTVKSEVALKLFRIYHGGLLHSSQAIRISTDMPSLNE